MSIASLVLALSPLLSPSAQEARQDSWTRLAEEYEQAFETWACELSRSGAWSKPESERPPSPAPSFWPRFEALADQGEGRAILWMFANLGGEGAEREAQLRSLVERMRKARRGEWFESALHALGGDHQGLDGAELAGYLESLRADGEPTELRVAATLALAAVKGEEDPVLAAELRQAAVVLRFEGIQLAPGDVVPAEDLTELATRLIEETDEAQQGHFERAYRLGSDDTYYPRCGAPPSPREVWSPVIGALADKGSTRARLWALSNADWQLSEAEKTRLAGHLEALTGEKLSEDDLAKLGYEIDGLVYRLGLAAVEPRVRKLIDACPDTLKPRMLFGLAAAICETAGEDAAQRERGLGLLREVCERWPASDPARSAQGRIFRYTNLVVGKKIPDFEAEDADGNAFKLSDYAGKVTVVDFWGFW